MVGNRSGACVEVGHSEGLPSCGDACYNNLASSGESDPAFTHGLENHVPPDQIITETDGLAHVDESTHGNLTMSPLINGPCQSQEITLGQGDVQGMLALYGAR